MSLTWLLLLKVSGLGILYLALAAALMGRIGRRRVPGRDAEPSVTILKPLHGAEPGLLDNLISFVRQDYAGPVQIVFGVQRMNDPAIAIVRRIQADHPDRDLVLVVDARQHGTNRKVSNLVNMAEHASHDVLVLADSDMRAAPDYLARLTADLAAPGVGAVTCAYHGLPEGNLWSRLSSLAIDTHFLPGVAMGVGLGIGHPCMGSTIALRREILDRVGGFRAIANDLADDHALGARVRGLGLSVAIAPFTVAHVCPERSLGELAHQELRWTRTIRQVQPWGHFGSVVTHPAAFALAALAIDPGPIAGCVLIAALAARIGLCLAAERAFGLKPHAYWLVPARDVLSVAIFVASFLGRGVRWRGYRYEAAPGGALLSKTRPDLT